MTVATYNLPTPGTEDNQWGEKINAAINAVNVDAVSALTPVDFYRRYVNNAWQVRGTAHPNIARIWIKHDASIPNPPEDATYFKAGTDLLLMAT